MNENLTVDANEMFKSASEYCKSHLKECCAELLEYQQTGILKNGHVCILACEYFTFVGAYTTQKNLAISLVHDEAMKFVLANS